MNRILENETITELLIHIETKQKEGVHTVEFNGFNDERGKLGTGKDTDLFESSST